MIEFEVFVNGIPSGTVEAVNESDARQIARSDSDMNPDSVPIDYIYAERLSAYMA